MKYINGLAFLIGALALVACGTPEPPPKPVTISFGYATGDNRASVREKYQDLAAQFNELYPQITVEVGFDDLLSAYTHGEIENDVLLLPDFTFGLFMDADGLLPLNSLIEMDSSFPVEDYYPGILDMFGRDGETFGIPAGVDPYVFFYNRDLFDQFGVVYPQMDWSWDDFLIATAAIRDPGAGVYGYGSTLFRGQDSRYLESTLFIYQHGGRIYDDLRNPTAFIFDDPIAIEALNWYASLYTVHGVAPTRTQASQAFGGPEDRAIYQGIGDGKVGIWGGGFSARRGSYYWPAPYAFRYGVLPPPRGQNSFNLAYGNAYVISTTTLYPEESWKWISFLCEQMDEVLVPVRKSMVESKAFETLVGGENAGVIRQIIPTVTLFPLLYNNEVVFDRSNFQTALEHMVERNEDPRDAMVWASER